MHQWYVELAEVPLKSNKRRRGLRMLSMQHFGTILAETANELMIECPFVFLSCRCGRRAQKTQSMLRLQQLPPRRPPELVVQSCCVSMLLFTKSFVVFFTGKPLSIIVTEMQLKIVLTGLSNRWGLLGSKTDLSLQLLLCISI